MLFFINLVIILTFKNIFDVRVIRKSPRRALPLLLCLLTFLTFQETTNIVVFAQTCSNPKFPLTLRFSSGETEIFSMDQDFSTENIYIAGITTAKELLLSGAAKSVFIALFNRFDYVWIKEINNNLVDTVEFMSAMGSSS